MMFRIGMIVVVVGFGIQMFSGYTYTVSDPAECPETWEGDPVTATEVLDAGGAVAGYWCLVQGSFSQTNEPRFHNIPVGERAGYAQWYGFAVMLAGAAIVGVAVWRERSRTVEAVPEYLPDEESPSDRQRPPSDASDS